MTSDLSLDFFNFVLALVHFVVAFVLIIAVSSLFIKGHGRPARRVLLKYKPKDEASIKAALEGERLRNVFPAKVSLQDQLSEKDQEISSTKKRIKISSKIKSDFPNLEDEFLLQFEKFSKRFGLVYWGSFIVSISLSLAVFLLYSKPRLEEVLEINSYEALSLSVIQEDEKLSNSIKSIENLATVLSNPDDYKFGVTRKAIDSLPSELVKLQVILDERRDSSQQLQNLMISQREEVEALRDRVQILSSLSNEEMATIKSVIFEESERSSRQYFLFGLFLSIPLFWFSEYLRRLASFLVMRNASVRKMFPFVAGAENAE